MITNSAVLPKPAQLHAGDSRSSASTETVDGVGADTRFLYGLLWGLIAATLIAGAVAAGLAAQLACGPLQP